MSKNLSERRSTKSDMSPVSLRSALPSSKTQNRVSQVLQVQVPLNPLRKKSTAKDIGTPSEFTNTSSFSLMYTCSAFLIQNSSAVMVSVLLVTPYKRCPDKIMSNFSVPSSSCPDSNSPQVVKKPPVNSSEEWSSKRPSEDTVSTISSLHSSPTVSPQGSPRKGALRALLTQSEALRVSPAELLHSNCHSARAEPHRRVEKLFYVRIVQVVLQRNESGDILFCGSCVFS